MQFDNRAVPAMVLTVTGGRLSEESRAKCEEYLSEAIRNRGNFHKVLILEGVEMSKIVVDMKDGDLKADRDPREDFVVAELKARVLAGEISDRHASMLYGLVAREGAETKQEKVIEALHTTVQRGSGTGVVEAVKALVEIGKRAEEKEAVLDERASAAAMVEAERVFESFDKHTHCCAVCMGAGCEACGPSPTAPNQVFDSVSKTWIDKVDQDTIETKLDVEPVEVESPSILVQEFEGAKAIRVPMDPNTIKVAIVALFVFLSVLATAICAAVVCSGAM